jgi:DNA-binding HxlR family transcriptional regulator
MSRWTYAGRTYPCPIALTAALLAGRWRSNVLWFVWKGTNRFNKLARALPQVNRGALLRVLRELEADGLLERIEHGPRPSSVEYALTRRAYSLFPLLEQMALWGSRNAQAVERSRGPSLRGSTRS